MDDKTKTGERTTLVVTAVPNPNEMASVQEYLQGALPLLKGAGGRPVKRLKVDEVIHGDPSGMVLVMEFDSADAITGMFESEGYAALVPVRDRGFAEMNILCKRRRPHGSRTTPPRDLGGVVVRDAWIGKALASGRWRNRGLWSAGGHDRDPRPSRAADQSGAVVSLSLAEIPARVMRG